ncbi:2-phospho-L-lactate transferase [Candidatus Heimdallarchaeota archaeon B3_Heim]|nr:MAG: 2-phospho-L-lactate transferase [Candidatus Heimdallarchaeota archaeon B3_Heim]
MGSLKIVFLSGGTGTPKLLQGINSLIDPRDITVIGNTGDDWRYYGLYVSPDIDSILFTLANLIDSTKWWGIHNDTFNMVKMLQNNLKEDVWFNLGDQDAGLCLFRTWLLNQGLSLTEATKQLANRLNIKSRILPMANQPIRTIIRTENEILHLQEYWVRHKGDLDVLNVFFEGDLSITTSEVITAIESADCIILGPSNPVSSLGPIVAISPIRDALRTSKAQKFAISPIIGNAALSGPTAKFLHAWNYETSPIVVVKLFHDFLDGILLHESDRNLESATQKLGVKALFGNIIIKTQTDAQQILNILLEEF